ncbi:MAG: hypothetical protein MZV64_35955 [Ignavibacteriales bacterium]|nr:hypothetical protein [Ignavibacteriales bacterium]
MKKTIREVSTETAEKIEADKKAEEEKSAKEKIKFYLKNFPIKGITDLCSSFFYSYPCSNIICTQLVNSAGLL